MGIKRNFLFSSILTVSNYIFPFLVYPYVARTLGVANIGICNFVDSIINYAMMVSTMGITIIGTRAIAMSKSDRAKTDATFTSLFMICLVFTLVSTAILIGVTYTVDALIPYRRLLLVGLIKLWGNFFLLDWFFRGLEDFRYITIRTIAVKLGYVACVYIFIRQSSDYPTYFLLMCLMVAVNAAFNCAKTLKLVSLRFDRRMLFVYLRPFVILGIYLLLNSMYTTFNVTFLGFKCGDTEVGYYTTSTKIFQILLAVYTAYSTVIMPRASALLSEGKEAEFKQLIHKSIDGLLLFSIPVIVFGVIYSGGIIDLIAGDKYTGAVVPLQIVLPLVFIIGYEQVLVVQILTPMARDRVILTNSIIGATVGVVGNIVLVQSLASVGSSIVWVSAEMAVLISAQFFVKKFTGISFPYRRLFNNILAYLPYAAISVGIAFFIGETAVSAMIAGAAILLIYVFAVQKYVLRNPVFEEFCAKYTKH